MNYRFTELTRKTESEEEKPDNLFDDFTKGWNDRDINNISSNRRYLILVKPVLFLISGITAALSMPGFNLATLAWFGFIPLIAGLIVEKSLSRSLLYSFLFGLGFYSLSLNWLLALHPLSWLGLNNFQSIALSTVVWILVSGYLSCYMLLFGLISKALMNLQSPVLKSILISVCWVTIMNKLTSTGMFAFPWALIEYSQYKNINLLQITQYIGGIGISFLIMFFNCFLSFIIVDFLNKSGKPKTLVYNVAGILTLIFAVHLTGNIILTGDHSHKITFLSTIIQNHSTLENKSNELLCICKTKKIFLDQIKHSPSGIIVMPETAIPDFIRYKDKKYYWNLDKVARMQNKTLIIGALDMKSNGNGKMLPTNAAIVIDKNLSISPENVYNKQFLVPFGEYIPFRNSIPEQFHAFINKLSDIDFYRGNKIKVINTSKGNIAPTICYEIVFPDLIRKQVQDNADILVNLSSLCWYHNSIIKDQFIAFGAMRAAEFRRPFIIAVNTGNSVFINYNGKILKMIPKNKAVTETQKLNYNNEKTFFSQFYL